MCVHTLKVNVSKGVIRYLIKDQGKYHDRDCESVYGKCP